MTAILDILRGNLTGDQLAAATDTAREVLTLACAGSGKSRTLAFRIARLVAEEDNPKGIVAFTFTEKAAESIKLRVARALVAAGLDPTVLGAMYIGTIHSYCQYVLAETDARYRQFDVLDENRLKLYLISRYPELELHLIRRARTPADAVRQIGYFNVIREVSDAWKIMNDELVDVQAIINEDPLLGRTLEMLNTNLDRDEYIDFSLMIRLVVEALRRGDQGAEQAVASVQHLMVDEYQDVNPSQEALIQALRQRVSSLFVVGDDDQAIYGWRGADVSNIMEFRNRYQDCAEHTLATNFRSTPAIVESADAFASAELGATRIEKNPDADDPGAPQDFRNLWFSTRTEEAQWVAGMIESLLGTAYVERDGEVRGLTPGDFAILMRSTKEKEQDGSPRHAAFTRELSVALNGSGIPYSLEAGGSIFDRPQVQALRATFELLRNGTPGRPIVQQHFNEAVRPAYEQASFTMLTQVLAEWGVLIHTPPGGARRRVYPQQLVHDLLNAFAIDRTDFDSATMQDIGIFSRILQDVETVYLSIDSAGRFRDILNFLGNVAESGYDTSTQDVLRRPDAVMVSTVHKVKGLEFPVVFLVDVEAQRFPKNQRGYDGWLPAAVIQAAIDRGAYQSTAREEARLFYTALTRAERYLYVSGCSSLPGGRRPRQPSRFTQRLADPRISTSSAGAPEGLTPQVPSRRIDETVLPTSYSEIRYYLRCPRDYQFRKSFGFSPPITEMFGFGMTVHAGVGKLHERFRDRAPTPEEAEAVGRAIFHLKHVPQSNDPINRPGPYERAKVRTEEILRDYAREYESDFARQRQVEVRFEVPVEQAVISGSIDLLLTEDEAGNILEASVIDFKAMEAGDQPEANEDLHWTELALQVQLYAKAAREVLGENARTGAVHLLKDNQRVEVPVTDEAIQAAVLNVEWAVGRILAGEFPMRPQEAKCEGCDFKALCPQAPEEFSITETPPPIHVPGNEPLAARAFSEFDG